MARPRKDQPLAPRRIKEAFWELIAEDDLRNITVGMITERACCNRGTFYYHFDSIDALLHAIIEEEMVRAQGLPRDLLLVFQEGSNPLFDGPLPYRVRRLCLLMERAGQERVSTQVKAVVVGMWEAILCDGADCLTQETRVIIEYSVSGIIGAMEYLYRQGELAGDEIPANAAAAIQQASCSLLHSIAEAQDVSAQEIEARILMFDRFLQMEETKAPQVVGA